MTGFAADLGIAARLARRELRGGVRGFRIFLACLALGVAAIAGIGSLGSAVREGLRADAQKILGGDVAVRLIHREASAEERSWLRSNATVSQAADLRAMAYTVRDKTRDAARDANGNTDESDPVQRRRILVELKGVDRLWPLYGSAGVDGKPAGHDRLAGLLSARAGVHGALVDPALPVRLGVAVGDRLRIGGQLFEIRGVLTGEPDRGTRLFTLGPRILVSRAGLEATGLVRHGSLIYFHYRLKLPPGADPAAFVERLNAALPKAGWRVRSLGQATPAAQEFLARIALYLSLVGLTALLVGGLGDANGVRAWLDGGVATMAPSNASAPPPALSSWPI